MTEQSQMDEILKDKPATPECPEDEAYGKALVWTKEKGWE